MAAGGRLRAAFFGSPDFAVPALEALAGAHDVVAVYVQPPRRAGRRGGPRRQPVHVRAEGLGLPVRTPARLGAEEARDLAALAPDVAVVAAYGLILPPAVLGAPRLGCVNVHASLLPRWRGAAPVERALIAGDEETGISIMLMDEGIDTGPVLAREGLAIGPGDTAGLLRERLAALGARTLLPALADLAGGRARPAPQPEEGATYAAKLTAADEVLDWREPAPALARRLRALLPLPGARVSFPDGPVKVWRAAVEETPSRDAPPGTVLDDALLVACGEGALRLLEVQRAGRGRMKAAAFLRGRPVPAGTILPAPAAGA